jgi:hypothetical protein
MNNLVARKQGASSIYNSVVELEHRKSYSVDPVSYFSGMQDPPWATSWTI